MKQKNNIAYTKNALYSKTVTTEHTEIDNEMNVFFKIILLFNT